MKNFFLATLIFFLVLGLIIFFQNIGATCSDFSILFYGFEQTDSASLLVIILATLGFLTGIFSTLLVNSILNSRQEEETEGSTW